VLVFLSRECKSYYRKRLYNKMSSTRFLEFDSTYRNRILYPNPANFVIEMNQSGQKTRETALDPMSLASPILSWNTSFREGASATTIVVASVDVSNSTSGQTVLEVTFTTDPRHIPNFYNGAVLSLEIAGPSLQRRRITKYIRVNTNIALITVDSAFSLDLAAVTGGTIENPTNATDTAIVPLFFIPAGKSIDNFYVDYVIDLYGAGGSLSDTATITSYNGTTHLATLDANTAATWLSGDLNFAMRRVSPQTPAQISSVANPVSASGRSIQLNLNSTPTAGDLVNSFMRMLEISGGGLPAAGDSTPTAPYGEERRIVRYVTGDGVIEAISGAVITLRSVDVTSQNYVGAIFTNVTIASASEVIAYNSSTRQITLAAAIGGAIGNVWTMRTAILETSFTSNPAVGGADTYEIEGYTRDNATPFNYTGSLDSVQEMCCYEVDLLNLILPNTFLSSGRGGLPVFHPYMYVELQQVSSSGGGTRGVIYSNNPNANRMLFRAVLDDTTQPAYSPFIKIDGDGMIHVIKFRPTDSFRFAVYHPNGSLFETEEQDTTGPTEPNPLVQISACFSFKRV